MRKKHLNKLISRVRARIEKVFGTLKPSYGYRRVRYIGIKAKRNGDVVQMHGL